ncbi:MAG: hypothetical protein KC474_11330 [Cyanobacteria bacterium HKST-UBA04]|nr:hypothetical protein [Cyanobacteria bacterium HKST-UBA04]MCA9841271.1 hypothetical protein [Cyanobacteria bacterium HKST-UBA03]
MAKKNLRDDVMPHILGKLVGGLAKKGIGKLAQGGKKNKQQEQGGGGGEQIAQLLKMMTQQGQQA